MDKDQLIKKLEQSAEWKLRAELERPRRLLANKFSLSVKATPTEDVDDLLRKSESALFNANREEWIRVEIETFMRSVKDFKEHIDHLEKQIFPQGGEA